MNLGLGTVQFGLNYGISNSAGQVAFDQVAQILQVAIQSGIHVLDTATAYGDSETVLGNCICNSQSFSIVTKTPVFKESKITPREVNQLISTFQNSLQKLNTASVYGLLIHQADDLLKPGAEQLWQAMQLFQKQGQVKKIGVSVYCEQQITELLTRYPIELIQLPINVLDQRLLQHNMLAELKQRNIEIHARSVFLQGLLLMPLSELPEFFSPIKPHLLAYHEAVNEFGMSLLQSSLGFVRNLSSIDAVIIGVTSVKELIEIVEAFSADFPGFNYDRFALEDTQFLNPSQWRL